MFDPLKMSSLQHSGCCCGKLPPMACLRTLASICLRSMTSWRKVTAWSSPRDAHPRSMNSWEHVSSSYLLLIHQAVALQWEDMNRGRQLWKSWFAQYSFLDFCQIMSQFIPFQSVFKIGILFLERNKDLKTIVWNYRICEKTDYILLYLK